MQPVVEPYSPHGQLVGRYRLERRLGRGGMGEVWLGRDRDSGQSAAVKLIGEEASAAARQQFEREWRAVARLDHPNIVHLHEVGERHLAMAFVDGPSLQRRLQSPIEPWQAIEWSLQIASALQHAHDRGITHRDVKPGNVLLDSKGNAYLADFGLALFDDDVQAQRGGTPTYMAPEQWSTDRIDPMADQYGLARTLVAMLIGSSPPSRDQVAVLLDPRLPADLVDALERAQSEEPGARWPSVSAFAQAVRRADVSTLSARDPVARLKRPVDGFAWTRECVTSDAHAHDIARADYRLSAMVASGFLTESGMQIFTRQTGYGDFGWAVFGRPSRLGPLAEPACVARASEVVVLLHGWGCTREIWTRVARQLCTENAELLVLVPDVQGFGESRFSGQWPALEHASPRGLYASVQQWLGLLALSDLPTVVVGHSMSGAAVLAGRDLPDTRRPYRVAIAPAWLDLHWLLGAWARLGAFLAGVLVYLGPAFRLITHDIGSGESGRRIAPHLQAQMVATMVAADRTAVVQVARGVARGEGPSKEAVLRTLVLAGEEDQMVQPSHLYAAAERAGIPRSHVRVLPNASHFPHIEDPRHPEYTARNTAEIVRGIDEMLMSCRDPTVVSSSPLGSGSSGSSGSSDSPETMMDFLSDEP